MSGAIADIVSKCGFWATNACNAASSCQADNVQYRRANGLPSIEYPTSPLALASCRRTAATRRANRNVAEYRRNGRYDPRMRYSRSGSVVANVFQGDAGIVILSSVRFAATTHDRENAPHAI